VKILEQYLTNGTNAMVEFLARHDFGGFVFFSKKTVTFSTYATHNSLNSWHLSLHLMN
jgi:hypothetical protein